MNTTISVICYKSKTLANGEYPLMLRITQNRKTQYKSLNISVDAKHLDFEKNTPKPKCPHKDIINKIILKTKLEYQQKVLEKTANEEEFTASSLIHEEKEEIRAATVDEFYTQLIQELKEKGQIGTSYAYPNSYDTLKNFNKKKRLNYTFSHIDVAFCKKFEDWMRRKGNKDTTISYQFRTLRAAFNRAIAAKVVSKTKNPFSEFKLSHLNIKTMKRALSKADIMKIMDADCSKQTEQRQLAHDIFCFSYLCGGISLVDIVNLTPLNIIDGRLIYQRQKTHGSINLLLSDKAMQIIAKYHRYHGNLLVSESNRTCLNCRAGADSRPQSGIKTENGELESDERTRSFLSNRNNRSNPKNHTIREYKTIARDHYESRAIALY